MCVFGTGAVLTSSVMVARSQLIGVAVISIFIEPASDHPLSPPMVHSTIGVASPAPVPAERTATQHISS